jgi:hypothetical protein
MTSRNDITGDKIQTKPTTKEYADNWDRIFGGSSPANGLCKKTPEGDLEVQVNGGKCCGKCKEEKK